MSPLIDEIELNIEINTDTLEFDENENIFILDDTFGQAYFPFYMMDYADGEQVQLKFNDGRGILTSYPNTTLVYAQDESKVDAIAKSFAGEELGYGKVYRFK